MGDVLLTVGRTVLRRREGKGPLPMGRVRGVSQGGVEPVVKGDLAGAQAGAVCGATWQPPPSPRRRRSRRRAELEGDAGGYALLAFPSLRM